MSFIYSHVKEGSRSPLHSLFQEIYRLLRPAIDMGACILASCWDATEMKEEEEESWLRLGKRKGG